MLLGGNYPYGWVADLRSSVMTPARERHLHML
jgi:hypothetical protein